MRDRAHDRDVIRALGELVPRRWAAEGLPGRAGVERVESAPGQRPIVTGKGAGVDRGLDSSDLRQRRGAAGYQQ
jgi:hypothetical protein